MYPIEMAPHLVRDLQAWDDLYRTVTAAELADFQAVIRHHPLWRH